MGHESKKDRAGPYKELCWICRPTSTQQRMAQPSMEALLALWTCESLRCSKRQLGLLHAAAC